MSDDTRGFSQFHKKNSPFPALLRIQGCDPNRIRKCLEDSRIRDGVCETTSPRSTRYCYEPVTDSRSIRLLSLDPGTNNKLTCCLSFASLSEPPSYEALSHVWSDVSGKSYIQYEGKSLSIPKSLSVALYRLRDATTPRVSWADAICINQHNIPERNQQVSMMGTVYSSASRVIAWLGDDGGNAKMAFDFIRRLQHKWPYNYNEGVPQLDPDHPVFLDLVLWKALQKFASNAYFERGWVQQEIGLAKYAIIYWRAFEISWDSICRISHNFLVHYGPFPVHKFGLYLGALHSTFTFYLTNGRRELVANRRYILDQTPHEKDFWNILYNSKDLRYSDRHDVVCAFLGHPSACFGENKAPIVLIDYTKSLNQVYTELAVRGLVDLKNSSTLSFVSH
ncbi:Heterokaryon incompatibility protein 6,OR allele [Lachnellula occidentalis]|uniref:Heterokaryon incompatibility protein 6,OR allele n=1 Tax=Lachnellula occidentalis TaxID=215460 RepID=A0A8H8S5I1_9HELO|nr:Heterokaryon incompatibility protein 6,OR allele [Lachnellula occidentalis]